MRPTAKEFLAQKHKSITLIGMSGVGKTTLSNKLPRNDWFHYSGDYRIGTRYLSEPIMDNIKAEAMKVPFLRDLLRSNSIYIANNITFHNLAPVSSFLGKLGNPDQGGMDLDQFKSRQDLHRQAEINAMLDVPKFMSKAQEIYQYPHFLNDVGGSICEVATQEVLDVLAENSIILYLKADETMEAEMLNRAMASPKPLFYRPDFLDDNVAAYLEENKLNDVVEIDPDKFAQWVFPRLIEHRKPLYQEIADNYGYTLDAGHIANIKIEAEFIEWVAQALDS